MLVLLEPGFDRSVDTAASVHLPSQSHVLHRVVGIDSRPISLNHLGTLVTTGTDVNMTGITIVRLEGFLVDLFLTLAEAAQLAILLDQAHDLLCMVLPFLQRHVTVPLHERSEPWVIRLKDELAVVADTLFPRLLIDLLLRICEMWEGQTNIGQKNDLITHYDYLD